MKFSKIFFYFMLPVFLVLMFLSYPVSNNRAGAVSSSLTNEVNFYGDDSEHPFYSVNVPDGLSLNNLQNLVINENSSLTASFNGYSLAPSSFWSQIDFDYNTYSGVTISNDISFSYMNIELIADITNYDELYLIVSLSNTDNVQQLFGLDRNTSTYFAKEYISEDNLYIAHFSQLGSFTNGNFGIQFTGSNLDVTINYIALVPELVEYFNINYFNQLFIDNGNTFINGYDWSESKSVLSDFSFDDIIYSDTNLYYTREFQYYSFSSNWTDVLVQLSNVESLTEKSFNSLISTFNKFNSLKFNTFANTIKSLANIFIYFFELLWYFVSTLTAPAIDLFRYLLAFLTTGLTSWVYLS